MGRCFPPVSGEPRSCAPTLRPVILLAVCSDTRPRDGFIALVKVAVQVRFWRWCFSGSAKLRLATPLTRAMKVSLVRLPARLAKCLHSDGVDGVAPPGFAPAQPTSKESQGLRKTPRNKFRRKKGVAGGDDEEGDSVLPAEMTKKAR